MIDRDFKSFMRGCIKDIRNLNNDEIIKRSVGELYFKIDT